MDKYAYKLAKTSLYNEVVVLIVLADIILWSDYNIYISLFASVSRLIHYNKYPFLRMSD